MSTTIFIEDKKKELPTYQSLSIPKTSKNKELGSFLHCCYYTFFFLTIIAISFGGYYFFINTPESYKSQEPNIAATDTQKTLQNSSKRPALPLISSESDDSSDEDDNSNDDDYYSSDENNDFKKIIKKATVSNGLFFPKIHETSDFKLEISDIDGDVHIGK